MSNYRQRSARRQQRRDESAGGVVDLPHEIARETPTASRVTRRIRAGGLQERLTLHCQIFVSPVGCPWQGLPGNKKEPEFESGLLSSRASLEGDAHATLQEVVAVARREHARRDTTAQEVAVFEVEPGVGALAQLVVEAGHPGVAVHADI